MTKKNVPCPICGEGNLSSHSEKIPVEFHGVHDEIDSYYAVCDACGSEQGGADEMRKNKRLMIAFKKRVLGLLTGAEVRRIRERFELTQKVAAEVFGGGPVAFSKYESDDVIQAASMDKLLRLTEAYPENIDFLLGRPCSVWEMVPDAIVDDRPASRMKDPVYREINATTKWRKIA